MHLHHINDLIQLQDVTVSNYYPELFMTIQKKLWTD